MRQGGLKYSPLFRTSPLIFANKFVLDFSETPFGSHMMDLKQEPKPALYFQEKCFCTYSSKLLLWIDIYGSTFLSLTGTKLKGPSKLDTEVHVFFC